MLAAIVVTLLMAANPGAVSAPTTSAVPMASAITAYLLIYGVYSGWAYPGYFGNESKSGGREIPKAIFGSIAAASFVYIGLLLLVGIAMVVVFSSANAYILIAPRILYGLGCDGLFFRCSAHVNRGGLRTGRRSSRSRFRLQ